MNQIGWIDFSSEHRDRVRSALDHLKSPGVVDELGIGVIRDSFADAMFPGISTIQTRAKYFTLTSVLLRQYQEKQPKKSLIDYLNEQERGCRIQLVKNHGESSQTIGIIGASFGTSNKQDVIRKPSSIYWNGLRKFGFVSTNKLSLREFAKRLEHQGSSHSSLLQAIEDDADALDSNRSPIIHAPEVPDDYLDQLSIELTPEEAAFLKEQIITHQADSLIGHILKQEKTIDEVRQLDDKDNFEGFCDLPFIKHLENKKLKRIVDHARHFSLLLEGAHIRYNCVLQERYQNLNFDEDWEQWREDISQFPPDWDTECMWQITSDQGRSIQNVTRKFVESWIAQCREGARDTNRCNDLVKLQELYNKKQRARLQGKNQAAVDGWIGLRRPSYRLKVVHDLVYDIHSGLSQKGGEHA